LPLATTHEDFGMTVRTRARWSGVALVALAIAGGVSAASELVGASAPDFVLKSLSGKNLRLSEYRGDVVMLSFWATWCGDCRAQLAELGAMRERYRDAGIELLAVSLDQSSRAAGEATTGVSYPVLHDAGGEVGRLYDVSKMPVMVLIDRGGVVREVFEGFRRGGEEQYLERIQTLLRE
jgi:peroxiredoxin